MREKEGQVIHRPELAEWPHYIGSEQVRNFRFEGDRLILFGEETQSSGERRRYQITWDLVKWEPRTADRQDADFTRQLKNFLDSPN